MLDGDELRRIAAQARADSGCACARLRCAGWEALPASFDESALQCLGSLAPAGDHGEATLEEYHPDGTHFWSPDAPIALGHFPYNRCELWQCTNCRRAFLRYTEYGGYYVERRIRELRAALIVDSDRLVGERAA